MFQKYFLILLAAALLSFVLYLFGTFFISSNRSYNQDKVVTEVENQEGIPGGHFKLRTHDGKIFDTIENQNPMLIYFGFTYCPDVCPITLLTMANVLDKLENEEITPLFITVDPERDNEEILSNYVTAFHDEIIGLTGTISDAGAPLTDAERAELEEANKILKESSVKGTRAELEAAKVGPYKNKEAYSTNIYNNFITQPSADPTKIFEDRED